MTGVVNVRIFLKWLKEQTDVDSSVRVHGNKVVLVRTTADYFNATVKVLRSIDPSKDVAYRKTDAFGS